MHFDNLLNRADDETLQELVGRDAVKLLNVIDPSLLRPSRLREVLIQLRNRVGLIRDKSTRDRLFELLRPKEAETLANLLDINTKDTYNGLINSSFRKNSQKENLLFDFLEISKPKAGKINSKATLSYTNPKYSLFDHQREAAKKVKKIVFQGSQRRTLLHMPTGSGKTRTTMNIISDHLRSNEPAVVIWLAYSEELCEQAATEFEKSWSFLGNRKVIVNRFWGSHEVDLEALNDGIVVSSLAKMYYTTNQGLYTLGQLGSKANLVIFDEAHQAIAPTYKYVLQALLQHSKDSGLIGLSATPGRTWNDISEDLELSNFFHNQKVTLEIEGYDNPVDYLVNEGYLADANYKKLKVDTDLNFTSKEASKLQEDLDIPNSVLRKLAADEKRNLKIISTIKELIKRHNRILFFATNVAHSDLIAKVLQATNHKAFSITSDTRDSNRKQWIKDFKKSSDEPMVLCNYGVLTTGFDAPNTSAALIARPTKSLVLYSQMVGRAIRGPKADGNEEAEIWTVIDQSLPGFGSVSEAFTNWEDVWTNQ